jgi:phosphonate transport system substrate-binding protein
MEWKRRRLLAAAASLVSVPTWAKRETEGLRIGLTPVILADQSAFLEHWSHYLSKRVGTRVHFVSRDAYQSILDLLTSGQIDAAWLCGYPYVRWRQRLELLAVPEYQGSPTYQAYLITRHDTGLRGWEGLSDRVLAYADPLSNSGWLVAQYELARAGLTARQLRRALFAHGHRNVAEAVHVGLADAGAIDGYVWDTLHKQGAETVAGTVVIWRSTPFGFPPLVQSSQQRHPLAAKLTEALVTMRGEPEGRELLANLNLSGFQVGNPSLYEGIARMARAMGAL